MIFNRRHPHQNGTKKPFLPPPISPIFRLFSHFGQRKNTAILRKTCAFLRKNDHCIFPHLICEICLKSQSISPIRLANIISHFGSSEMNIVTSKYTYTANLAASSILQPRIIHSIYHFSQATSLLFSPKS